MGLVKNVWQGFAGGPDSHRQQTQRFLLEDIQVQIRLPHSNVETIASPRHVNFPYKTPGWFERNMEQQRQHYCFVKKHKLGDSQNPDQAILDYNTRRQALTINDLKRYGIKSLLISEYSTEMISFSK